MSDQDAFDAELENLEATLDRARQADAQLYHEHEAIRKRFEESELWQEHKRWHEEQGTHARLEVRETEVPVAQEAPAEEQASPAHLKTVRFGVCQCQPFNALLQLDDKGQVVTGLAPVEEKQTYGLSAGSGTTEYLGQGGTPNNSYQIDPSLSKDLYR